MKLEKLSSLKFEDFKAHSIKNANAVMGGAYETDGANNTHDEATTYSNGKADGVTISADGTSIKSDQSQ